MKNVFIVVGVIGFFVLLGAAGASDTGLLEQNELILRIAVGMTMMILGYLGAHLIPNRKQEKFSRSYQRNMIKEKEYSHTHHAA